ncbi:hypothetical protein PCANC_23893 [Puccinia coronata f. sp. avenae]|uniref:Uncharacterized protein n=1 Tax=Puccinia coronata f. sp. avenae TaxID=200324 RepID=A0A2N5TZ65_9BASI|nr:hypothetical protein PCANC_23893 [Puccinia coronata f. sp. avenae]
MNPMGSARAYSTFFLSRSLVTPDSTNRQPGSKGLELQGTRCAVIGTSCIVLGINTSYIVLGISTHTNYIVLGQFSSG